MSVVSDGGRRGGCSSAVAYRVVDFIIGNGYTRGYWATATGGTDWYIHTTGGCIDIKDANFAQWISKLYSKGAATQTGEL